ncbi:hypothetical protein ACNS7O_06635 [Haloferacaceae archaeon DSL9]
MTDSEGFSDGVQSSKGDPRVLFALNLFLSACFAATVIWGLSFLDVVALSLVNVASLTVVIFSLTYLLVLR